MRAEEYSIQKDNTTLPLGGGIHDKVRYMDKEACVNYLVIEAIHHKELLNMTFFNSTIAYPVPAAFLNLGGLDDYIFRENRETLNQWALTAERFDRNGQFLIGGLEDELHSMSDTDVAEYVLKMAKKHPELNSGDRLNTLGKGYGIIPSTAAFLNIGGLDDYIFRENRETLDAWALTAERFDRNGQFLIGGLEDRLHSMSDRDVAEYVLEMAQKHPELNSGDKLNLLAKGYGFISSTSTY